MAVVFSPEADRLLEHGQRAVHSLSHNPETSKRHVLKLGARNTKTSPAILPCFEPAVAGKQNLSVS